MAKYKNTRTGATIDVASIVSGEHWFLIDDEPVKNVENIEDVAVSNNSQLHNSELKDPLKQEDGNEPSGVSDITKAQIMQELDAFGIKYDPRMKKQELYELMLNGK